MPAGFDEKTRIEDGSSSMRSATAASALFRERGRSPFAEPFCDGGRSVFNRPSIFVSVLWIASETSLSEAETAAASLLRVRDLRGHRREPPRHRAFDFHTVRDGGRSASSPPVLFGSILER